MARIQIANDPSGRIIVFSPYDALLVAKVKTIEGRKWHPGEKHWHFPNAPNPRYQLPTEPPNNPEYFGIIPSKYTQSEFKDTVEIVLGKQVRKKGGYPRELGA